MDALQALTGQIRLDKLSAKPEELLLRLQQAGLFRAIVLARQGDQVVLDTAFGRLSGKAPTNLQRGDEITARLLTDRREPTIKVELHAPRVWTLPRQQARSILDARVILPTIARVIAADHQQTTLQVANRSISLPRQPALSVGDRVLLQPSGKGELQLQRTQPEAVLKRALSALLPRSGDPHRGIELAPLQKLSSRLLTADIRPVVEPLQQQTRSQPPVASSATSPAAGPKAGENANRSANTPIDAPKPVRGDAAHAEPRSAEQLRTLLTSLATPPTNVQQFNAESVQKIMAFLSLIKPAGTLAPAMAPSALPTILHELASTLRHAPDSFRQLVSELIAHKGQAEPRTTATERLPVEAIQSMRGELLQQVEQTLAQLMTQKTTLSLQLEQQQPLQFNVSVPIEIEKETREFKLRITEKPRQENAGDQHWEIQLSFAFGELGLVTTNILLQDQRLSAQFWSERSHTQQLIDQHMDQFRAQLLRSGFEPGLLNSYVGQPPDQPVSDNRIAVSDNLLDVNA